jgi:myo-inositol-1(or 4)-monophosphatase
MHEELLELARKVGAEAAALLMDRPPAFEIEEKTTAIDIVTQMDKKA